MKKNHNFKVNNIYKNGARVAAVTLKNSSLFIGLAAASILLAFAINSVFAAPAGPPASPSVNVSPNFDSLTITGGGKIHAKNFTGKDRVVIDGEEGTIQLKSTDGTSDVITLDPSNAATLNIKGASPVIILDGDDGASHFENNAFYIMTGGSRKIDVETNSNGGSLAIYSAFGITRPYIKMLVDGTTSLLNLAGGTLDVATLKNSSSESLGNIYVDDDVRIGSSHTLKADNITGTSSDWVKLKNAFINVIMAKDSISIRDGSDRVELRKDSTTGAGVIVLRNSSGAERIKMDAAGGDITTKGDVFIDGAFMSNGVLVAKGGIESDGGVHADQDISTDGNLTSKGKIGSYYAIDKLTNVTIPPNSKLPAALYVECNKPTHQVVSCGGNYTNTNGIMYMGAWRSGNKCKAQFFNSTSSTKSGRAFVDIYCFDPSSN